MTNDVGAALKAARERLGLTLAQAEEATKIRHRFLQALEENDHTVLGGDIYVRGFLKNYATFLGLDSNELLPPSENVVPIVSSSSTRETEILSLPLRDTSFPFGRILFMVAAFVALGVAAFYLWQPVQRAALLDQFSAYLPLPTPTITAITAGAGGDPASTATIPEPTATEAIAVAPESTPTSTPVPTATLPPRTPTPDLTATAVPTNTPPPPVQGIVLGVRVTSSSWTQVYLDDDANPVLERTLAEGETFEWTGQERVYLRLGNAGGVIVTLNGQELGTLGDSGAVINRLWILDPATGQPVEADPNTN
jgi:cytoskeleton protein RodZ